MTSLAVFCSGNGSNFQAIVDAAKKRKLNASVAVMVCDNPKAFAIKRAHQENIPVVLISPRLFQNRKDYEKVIVGILKSQKIDLIILAGFMRILTPYFINAYKKRILNIHPSFLPDFKGAHAIRDAFEAKVRQTGVSVHVVTEELDAGPILAQERVKVKKNDTLASLETRIHHVERQLYPKAIGRYILEAARRKS